HTDRAVSSVEYAVRARRGFGVRRQSAATTPLWEGAERRGGPEHDRPGCADDTHLAFRSWAPQARRLPSAQARSLCSGPAARLRRIPKRCRATLATALQSAPTTRHFDWSDGATDITRRFQKPAH